MESTSAERIAGRYPVTGLLASVACCINKFAYSSAYLFLVSVMAIAANIFALELEIYTAYVLLAAIFCTFCRDMLPIIPLVILCYIIPSSQNNPGTSAQSIFYLEQSGYYVLALAVIVTVLFGVRFALDRQAGFQNIPKQKYRLSIGIMLLGLAYMISGIGAPGYRDLAGKNIFFGFLQFVALALPYFLFSFSVQWNRAPVDYFVKVGIAVGLVLLAETANFYISQNAIVNGVIDRAAIHTGWGMHNNIGGMLAMMLPFPFCLACRKGKGIPGVLLGTLIMIGIALTTSRSSILVGAAIYLVCIIFTIIFSADRLSTILTTGFLILLSCPIFYHYWEEIQSLFHSIIEIGADSSGRDEIYHEGFLQFLDYPVFGGSFYPINFVPYDHSEIESFSAFFPPRWHNTIIQLLASCGIIGLAAYIFHRFQTVRILFCNPSLEKTFIGLSVLALLLTSLLDCHFFNIGPVLFYSMSLAFAEKANAGKLPGKYEKTN